MVADAVAWLCRSPRRLAVAIGAAVLLVVIGSAMASNGDGGQPDAASSPQPSPPAAAVPDASPMVEAAVRFVDTWSRHKEGESAGQWHARVAPLTTPELAAVLAQTDLEELPGAGPQGTPTVRYVAQDSALIAVPLANRSSVVVTVVAAGRSSWQVSDVQPDVGDVGDVP